MRRRTLRGFATCLASTIAAAAGAQSIVASRCATWSGAGAEPHAFAVIQVERAWTHAQASAFAAQLGARLAVLPTTHALGEATMLCITPNFWQCAGPWVGSSRGQDESWKWVNGDSINPTLWAAGRPAQPSGLSACAMLAGESAPSGGLFDALDADLDAASTSSALLEWETPSDCDGDGTQDAIQIAIDPALDADFDGLLDTCARSPDLDGNGLVDFADIALVLLDFGECPGCPSDQDGNGIVDNGDVAIILMNFGSVPGVR